ncbi:DUF1800 domain-containing protein [Chloroflexi bacterium TSY]|nr:DUF1800 domain-containing protein [Chloroflexi bacterium TSY]
MNQTHRIETENRPSNQLNRRSALRALGATATATAVSTMVPASAAEAQEGRADIPTMRSSERRMFSMTGGLPDVPALPVIALNRMGFGPSPGDFAAFDALGNTPDERFQTYVDQQLNPNSIPDPECDAKLAEQNFATLNLSLAQTWTAYVRKDGEQYKQNERAQAAFDIEKATFIRAVYSKRQLLEVLVDHWHDHFNVYGWEYWTAPVWNHYDRDVIRRYALGNFREMLEAVGTSPAMLYYLDNQSNRGGDPNENYARELFELHGMGAENYLGVRDSNDPDIFDENGDRKGYIDADVYGATTCFTGWRISGDTGLFEYDDSIHFPFQKVLMNQVIDPFGGIQDGKDVFDIIVQHPGTARYVCRRLCRRLISDNPPESVVEAAAAVFRANLTAPDQLKKVVRTILLSSEFKITWGEKFKRPFEFAVSILRATNADFIPDRYFFYAYDSTGQALFNWRPPDGYPDVKDAWSSTMPMLQRWRLANWLVRWEYREGPNKGQPRLPLIAQTPSAVKTPIQLVDYWSNRILGRTLPAEEYQPIVDFMAFGRSPTQNLPQDDLEERLPHMVGLILMAVSFQWR